MELNLLKPTSYMIYIKLLFIYNLLFKFKNGINLLL